MKLKLKCDLGKSVCEKGEISIWFVWKVIQVLGFTGDDLE
jgi:hypothetical protein